MRIGVILGIYRIIPVSIIPGIMLRCLKACVAGVCFLCLREVLESALMFV